MSHYERWPAVTVTWKPKRCA